MNKRTGDLFEACPVSLFDYDDVRYDVPGDIPYSIGMIQQDGWIFFNPGASPFGFFINMTATEFFENLGEL